jgi:hypothetical protein
MSRHTAAGAVACLLILANAPCDAQEGPVRLQTRSFATLPADVRNPEALAANPATGEIFVATFDAREPAETRRNALLRLSADGKLLARRSFGATPLTGIEFRDGHVYVVNFGASSLQRIAADFDGNTPIEDIARFGALSPPSPTTRTIDNPDGSRDSIQYGSKGFPAPNGTVFDREGNLYVSDSFQGAIYRIDNATQCRPCEVQVVSRDPLLGTTGPLPFGANGMALDADQKVLFVNNAGDGRVLRMDLASGKATVLADGLLGADGLIMHDGLLWVSANQIDTVVAIDLQGRVRALAGRFDGIGVDGSPQGLLFPASSVVSGERMVVANLALPLTPQKGDEWEESVSRWNLVQFDLP